MKSETILFLGAGLTAALGIPTTIAQDKILGRFFFSESAEQFASSSDIWPLDQQDAKRLFQLRALKTSDFDIPGLCCYVNNFFTKESYSVMAMYNLLDMQISMGQAYSVIDEAGNPKLIRPEEIVCYRRGMLVLLQALFSICQQKALNHDKVGEYIHFFRKIAEMILRDKLDQIQQGIDLTSDNFIFSKLSYVSTNWDVLFLWFMFQAHKALNDENRNHIAVSGKNLKLKIFNDFAI